MTPNRYGFLFDSFLMAFAFLLFHPASSHSGVLREFHANGQIHIEGETDEQQLPHGTSREFDENGNLVLERNYEHGVLQGISRRYYPTGEVQTEWIYEKGRRSGISLGYFKSGKIKDRGYYENDRLNGTVRLYSPDGTLKSELNFNDDRPEGEAKTYRPDGTVEFLYQYHNGQLIRRKSFDRKGSPIQDQEFPYRGNQP